MTAAGRRFGEGRLALAVASAAVLLTSLPRLYMELTAPRGQIFLGKIWGVYDIPRYVLLRRQSAAGAWLFDNRLEGPDHTAFVLYTPYLLLGHVLGWTRIPPLAMMEIGRWIAFPAALSLPAGSSSAGRCPWDGGRWGISAPSSPAAAASSSSCGQRRRSA